MDIFTVFPTISTSFIVLSAVLVAIGWWLIIKGKREAHKKTMIAAAIAALLFLLFMYLERCSWETPHGADRMNFRRFIKCF